ncbi:MAG TPA: hypothetical protein VJ765_01675 [Chitinophagaceae bacterium]|nr:hypothetical protein [Chitinophagaceae bacterium]
MNHSEKEYIALCKRLIEEKFHFENGSGSLRQRDLEYLADSIEEKSGVKLSLSTLKRLWKKDYDQTPHPSTLDALASMLGYKSWQDFKLQQTSAPETPVSKELKKVKRIFTPWTILLVVLSVGTLSWLIAFRSGKQDKTKPIIDGAVTFTGNKTVSQGVPNTVIFNYDVGNVEADSFFFQQSWNNMDKVKLDPKGHSYSNIYYYPGFHKAKLIANDSIIKRFRVHITTAGWLPMIGYESGHNNMPVYVKNTKQEPTGLLHINRNDLITSGVNIDNDFILSYYNIREFKNTNSDNFSIDTRIICDSSNTIACPGFQLVIACEEHIFYVSMKGKGCERNIAVKMGEIALNGISTDLSAFGRDLYKWQHLRIQVVNKKATIYIDEQPAYTINFKNDFGKIVGLTYHFLGTGAIDYVKLKNGENKIVYDDEFDNAKDPASDGKKF